MTEIKEAIPVGKQVLVNFHQSGLAGNAHIVSFKYTDTGVVYDIIVDIVTNDPSKDTQELKDTGYKISLKDIPAVFVLEIVYDETLVNNVQHQEAEDAIQEAVVVSEDDAILDAMKNLVIEHETNKAETETMKVNRDVDAE